MDVTTAEEARIAEEAGRTFSGLQVLLSSNTHRQRLVHLVTRM